MHSFKSNQIKSNQDIFNVRIMYNDISLYHIIHLNANIYHESLLKVFIQDHSEKLLRVEAFFLGGGSARILPYCRIGLPDFVYLLRRGGGLHFTNY